MRSLFAVALLSTLSLGCVSTKADEPVLSEGADPVADKGPQEPCPAPPALVADEKPLEESEPVKLEESGAAADTAQGPTPAPAEPAPVATGTDKPDARSHMDVAAVPDEIADRRDYFVKTSGLNVRAEPSAQSAVVRQLRRGEKVTSWGREGIWVQIAENEYVSIIYLSDQQAPAQADNASK